MKDDRKKTLSFLEKKGERIVGFFQEKKADVGTEKGEKE